MPVFKRHKMCSECPFRAKAIKGWLGPHTVDQVNKAAHGEEAFICHKDLDQLPAELSEEEILEQGQQCVGMARYRNSVFKLPRDDEQAAFQDRLEEIPDQPTIAPFKFVEHHSSKLK